MTITEATKIKELTEESFDIPLKPTHADQLNPLDEEYHMSLLTRLPWGEVMFRKNRRVLNCPYRVRQLLHDFYLKMDPEYLRKDDVVTLTGNLIPSAGFSNGCIYFYEQWDRLLIPKVPIGSRPLHQYHAVDCSPIAPGVNPIAAAFHCDSSISTKSIGSSGPRICLAHVLGTIQRAGVLYLESSEELATDRTVDVTSIFEAVSQALQDCLRLR